GAWQGPPGARATRPAIGGRGVDDASPRPVRGRGRFSRHRSGILPVRARSTTRRRTARRIDMERLSGLDSAFLSMETPSMHFHVAIAAVVDPSTMPAPYSFDQLRDFIARRLIAHAAFRRRVVEVPFKLNHPIWVEDPALDLDYHVRRHALPAPGGPRQLADLVAAIVGVPLDRSRPLWEVHVVEGLHDGNVALLGKIHHAAVDGVSGAELFVHLFDLTPEPAGDAGGGSVV